MRSPSGSGDRRRSLRRSRQPPSASPEHLSQQRHSGAASEGSLGGGGGGGGGLYLYATPPKGVYDAPGTASTASTGKSTPASIPRRAGPPPPLQPQPQQSQFQSQLQHADEAAPLLPRPPASPRPAQALNPPPPAPPPPSTGMRRAPSREDMALARMGLEGKPIRSSGLGATANARRHRRALSADYVPRPTPPPSPPPSGGWGGYGGYGAVSQAQAQAHWEATDPAHHHRPPSRVARKLSFDRYAATPDPPRSRAGSWAAEDGERTSPPLGSLPPRPRSRANSADPPPQSQPHRLGYVAGSASASPSISDPATVMAAKHALPPHRRNDSSSSLMSFLSEASGATAVSGVSQSRLFRGVSDSGEVRIHLPLDNVLISMDPDLEAGTLYKRTEEGEGELFRAYHDPDGQQDLRGFSFDEDGGGGFGGGLASGGTDPHPYPYPHSPHSPHSPHHAPCSDCPNCGAARRDALPDVRYVLNVDPDLFQRVLNEVAESRKLPCGLFFCGHHDDQGRPSILIALGIVVAFFLAMFYVMASLG